jgi:hypothetical protein
VGDAAVDEHQGADRRFVAWQVLKHRRYAGRSRCGDAHLRGAALARRGVPRDEVRGVWFGGACRRPSSSRSRWARRDRSSS